MKKGYMVWSNSRSAGRGGRIGRMASAAFLLMIFTVLANAQTFTKITSGKPVTDLASSIGVSWIDYDGDGNQDIFVANGGASARNFLYRNNGNGGFEKIKRTDLVKRRGNSNGNSWADYDNDGDLDVFVSGNPCTLYRNEGEGRFTRIASGATAASNVVGWGSAWADYDNDGNVDLIVANPGKFFGNTESNFLFHNDGPPNYTFSRVNDRIVEGEVGNFTVPTWSDFDGDGDMDLFLSNGPANGSLDSNRLFKNMLKETGKAEFRRIDQSPISTDRGDGQVLNWIDYDNDGDLDLYVTNFGAGPSGGLQNNLYRNDGGIFTRITKGGIVNDRDVSLASVWADFDNDGDLDAYVTNQSLNRYYRNNGDGTFESVTTGAIVAQGSASFGAATGDYNNDGFLDLYVGNVGRQGIGTANFLFRNDGNSNSWIKVKCIGTVSNRAAIGARVKALAVINGEPVWQMREISSQNSFSGQNSLDVHFGFGEATRVEKLIIEWPSGMTEELSGVSVKQSITVTEGQGVKDKK
jgi:enediyne biosynthesis protein E4